MSQKKVTLVYSLKNTFVLKDSLLLKQMGYEVLLIQSAPHSDLARFFWNRIRELILGFYYIIKSEVVYSWFNDYHSTAAIFWAIFLKNNLRKSLARWNYKNASEIWVVHKSLSEGCTSATNQDKTQSGILNFMPDLKTPIREVPTAYDDTFWQREGNKTSNSILTVANIADKRTYERKGIPLFVKLAEALPNYNFTIAGIQTKSKGFESLPKNIRLLGTLDREGLKKEYSRHQFYFQGSQVEGLPNVLCEAMLCECIPLGNSVFGIPDAIGATGHIFEGAKALASVIEFVERIKNTTELGEKARERIKNHYPISRRVEAFEKPLNLTEDEN
jgi:glycosyltransferase involved in cell wall biosynthesis